MFGSDSSREVTFMPVEAEINYNGFNCHHSALVLAVNGEQKLVLNWLNTVIKRYNDETFDHIEITTEEGEKFIRIDDRTEDLVDFLYNNNYPYLEAPIPDSDTINWVVRAQAQIGDLVIESFIRESEQEYE